MKKNTRFTNKSISTILAMMIIGALFVALVGINQNYFKNASDNWRYKIADNVFDSGFVDGKPGDCVDWDLTNLENRGLTKCKKGHRFEISGIIYLNDQFDNSASYPSNTQWHAIEKQFCEISVVDFFQNKFDKKGKYISAGLIPSEKQWLDGIRKMACGVQIKSIKDNPLPPKSFNNLTSTDQSDVFPAGSCLINLKDVGLTPVNCRSPHSYQVAKIFSFSNPATLKLLKIKNTLWPSLNTQNQALGNYCYLNAKKYFGDDIMKLSQIITAWGTISKQSWDAGSRQNICYIAAFEDNKSLKIEGSFKNQKELLINGKKPNYNKEAPPGRSLPTPIDINQNTNL